jgi:hypothetical protein
MFFLFILDKILNQSNQKQFILAKKKNTEHNQRE